MIILGDLHGEFARFGHTIQQQEIRDQTIIQVGDFGVGFNPLREAAGLANLDRILEEHGCHLYAIRGNHDDPAYFVPGQERSWSAASLLGPHPHITLLPDYSVITVETRKLFLTGGAISVDRRQRLPGVSYWPDERFHLDPDRLAACDLTDVWAVVTHTAPSFAPPVSPSRLVESFAWSDHGLLRDLRHEREELSTLYALVCSRCTPRYWSYGHFHAHDTLVFEQTEFLMLDVAQMIWLN